MSEHVTAKEQEIFDLETILKYGEPSRSLEIVRGYNKALRDLFGNADKVVLPLIVAAVVNSRELLKLRVAAEKELNNG